MAKGKLGKTYEAIICASLLLLKRKKIISENIYWNETPSSISVEPDLMIGNNKDAPSVVLMISHGDSSKNSDMKCWRNISELTEVKTKITPETKAINIIFDNGLKDELIRMEAAAFDSQIVVRELSIRDNVRTWADTNKDILPIEQWDKASTIINMSKSNRMLKKILETLQSELVKAFPCKNEAMIHLWKIHSNRLCLQSPIVSETFIRRGMTKRLLLGKGIDPVRIRNNDADWLIKLGIAEERIGGYRIKDSDLKWFLRTKYAANYLEISRHCMSAGFKKQIIRVRSIELINEYQRFVIKNYAQLITKDGMLNCLNRLNKDPAYEIVVPENVLPPQNIWIFDFIAALSKAAAGKAQAFGYSVFSLHPDGQTQYIGKMTLGRWCTSFACEYFNRNKEVSIPNIVAPYIAMILSEQLSKFSKDDIERLSNSIISSYINKEYEDVLLSHRGFDPIMGVLLYEKILPNKECMKSIRTCFSEKAGISGQGGRNTVAIIKHTLLKWQSAFKNPRDKRKELCGRAVGLRYTWDKNLQLFVDRPGIEKMVLVLDGTWGQVDINALLASGWDEVYFIDEIDKLKASIV